LPGRGGRQSGHAGDGGLGHIWAECLTTRSRKRGGGKKKRVEVSRLTAMNGGGRGPGSTAEVSSLPVKGKKISAASLRTLGNGVRVGVLWKKGVGVFSYVDWNSSWGVPK